jgi:hypothetical protein
MPRVLKVTLTYLQRIQLAPYNHVDAGLVVEVEPNPEDGPEALSDLAAIVAAAWGTVGPATKVQIHTAVTEFDDLQEQRRQRLAAGQAPLRSPAGGNGSGGATHTPTEPSPATAKQREMIAALRGSLNWPEEDLVAFAQQLGVDLATLNRGEASALLTAMQSQPRKRRPPAQPEADSGFPARQGEPPAEPEPSPEPPAPTPPPRTPEEAAQRFFARYGEPLGGTTLADVRRFLGEPRLAQPTTVEAWVTLAERVRDALRAAAQPES